MKNKHKFFSHQDCEFFPCHKNLLASKYIEKENFNCLFCYCPLFNTKECILKTTVSFGEEYDLENNILTQDESYCSFCKHCTFPHDKANYNEIIKKLKKIHRES